MGAFRRALSFCISAAVCASSSLLIAPLTSLSLSKVLLREHAGRESTCCKALCLCADALCCLYLAHWLSCRGWACCVPDLAFGCRIWAAAPLCFVSLALLLWCRTWLSVCSIWRAFSLFCRLCAMLSRALSEEEGLSVSLLLLAACSDREAPLWALSSTLDAFERPSASVASA